MGIIPNVGKVDQPQHHVRTCGASNLGNAARVCRADTYASTGFTLCRAVDRLVLGIAASGLGITS
jgi:hypothetical protein